jgi:hypothetical protein
MPVLAEIRWPINPFRGDRFAEGWLPVAEAALDYGATSWAFYRALDGRLDFIQHAIFPAKDDFDRYWYSETVAEALTELAGYYQVPLQPKLFEIVGRGAAIEASSAH